MHSLPIRFAITFSLVMGSMSFARAETLKNAMARAYINNPTLKAERARLRATDEGVAIARSGYRPTITGNIDLENKYRKTRPASITDGNNQKQTYSITLNQPIFRGFRTENEEFEADENVLAGRSDLGRVEQEVLIDTATSYMDVIRDRATLRLRRRNITVLDKELRAAKERLAVGEVTATDVAQAVSRKSRSIADFTVAEANLKVSRASYQRVVGKMPGKLHYPPSLRRLFPRNLDSALKRGTSQHPQILAAIFRERAADYKIRQIKGERLPEVNFSTNYTRTQNPSRITDRTDEVSGKINIRIPLYQSGSVYARIRQAREIHRQRLLQVDEARRLINSRVIAAWGQLNSTRKQIRAGKTSVSSTKIALNGVREEEKVGQRTVLDTLNAEQEVLDAEVILVRARRDFFVAAFTLLSATGQLNVTDINAPVHSYDPTGHYDYVRDKWRGIDTSPDDVGAH